MAGQRRRMALGALALPLLGGAARPPGDPEAAVQAEFDAAAAAGTLAAWDAFLARHPDSPLATAARAARDRLVPR